MALIITGRWSSTCECRALSRLPAGTRGRSQGTGRCLRGGRGPRHRTQIERASVYGTRVPFTASPRPRIHSSPLLINWVEVSAIPCGGNRFRRSMKNSKRRPSASGVGRAARERDAQQEIKSFLSALASYPERFALEPDLSFEQHLFHLVAANQLANSEGHRRS